MARFEGNYIEFLYQNGSFRDVNRQISLFLLHNVVDLQIESIGNTQTENVFGNNSECALWKRLD